MAKSDLLNPWGGDVDKPSTLSPAVLSPGRLIFIAVSRFGLFDMKLEGKLEYGNTAAK